MYARHMLRYIITSKYWMRDFVNVNIIMFQLFNFFQKSFIIFIQCSKNFKKTINAFNINSWSFVDNLRNTLLFAFIATNNKLVHDFFDVFLIVNNNNCIILTFDKIVKSLKKFWLWWVVFFKRRRSHELNDRIELDFVSYI